VAWAFSASRAGVFGLMRSRCVYEGPAVSSCARTYSGQRPGRTSGPLNLLSSLRRLSGDRLAGVPARWKIIGSPRSDPCIAHNARRPAAACGPRQRDLVAEWPSCCRPGSAVMSASPDCAACRPGPRCRGPGAGRLCAHPLAAVPVTLSVWTLDGPAVDLWWTWDVPGDLAPRPRHRCWWEVKYWRQLCIDTAEDRRCREAGPGRDCPVSQAGGGVAREPRAGITQLVGDIAGG
jgi:hypothetical protein